MFLACAGHRKWLVTSQSEKIKLEGRVLVTTSKAPVTTSVAPVTTSKAPVTTSVAPKLEGRDLVWHSHSTGLEHNLL